MPLVAPWNRKKRAKRAKREKIGHEAPGTVLRGPPIAITCECGEKRDLRYGEEWRCESCGRRWDTNQIPVEQYEAIRRTQLRFRVLPVLYGLVILALAMFFTLTGNIFSVFILLPLGLMLWFYFVRPAHRRRYRRAVADLPKWELRPQ
jgi:Flp pilus assembly protein TadB